MNPLWNPLPLSVAVVLLAAGCPGEAGSGDQRIPAAVDGSIDSAPADGPCDVTPSDAKSPDAIPDAKPPLSYTVNDRLIVADSVKVKTPCTWNAHLPKLVTDGIWSYAVFTRYTPGHAGRLSKIYKAKGSGPWSYGGRQLTAVHQPPGLALDTKGQLHVVFDCLAGFTCSTAGVAAGATTRFYDLIFYKNSTDGSVYLGDSFANHNEFTGASYGYMGVGVDPKGGQAHVSLATSGQQSTKSHFTQQLFQTGTAAPAFATIPKVSGAGANTLYPQLAFNPGGTLYLSVGELVAGWTSSAQYSHVVLFKRPPGGSLTKVYSDSVTNPDGNTRRIYTSDLALSSTGKAYFLYYKLPKDAQGNCSYLVHELATGGFSTPRGVGCHGSYTQLQLDSNDDLLLLTTSGPQLKLLRSTDGGQSFTTHLITLTSQPTASAYLQSPTLVKPWTSPKGYDPDVLFGFYSGADSSNDSWYAGSFTIVVK
jgi:hypothetical protein